MLVGVKILNSKHSKVKVYVTGKKICFSSVRPFWPEWPAYRCAEWPIHSMFCDFLNIFSPNNNHHNAEICPIYLFLSAPSSFGGTIVLFWWEIYFYRCCLRKGWSDVEERRREKHKPLIWKMQFASFPRNVVKEKVEWGRNNYAKRSPIPVRFSSVCIHFYKVNGGRASLHFSMSWESSRIKCL